MLLFIFTNWKPYHSSLFFKTSILLISVLKITDLSAPRSYLGLPYLISSFSGHSLINKLIFTPGSRSSLATPDSLRLNSSTTSDKHSPSPLPNKEASRSSQPSPASSLKSAGALSSSQSPSPSPTKNSISSGGGKVVGGKDSPCSPFSKLVASTKTDTGMKEDGLCQREKTVQDLFNIDKVIIDFMLREENRKQSIHCIVK